MLALDPLAPLAVGFWLSFGAVAVILLATSGEVVQNRAVAGFATAQLAVTIGLIPVLAACFGNVSLVSAPVNVIAIPLYTLMIVPAVLLASAGALVSPDRGRGACWAPSPG